jgi:aspartate/methionine/tyrosine aminotransferase
MKIERFGLERWMTTWELDVECDIAESGILPLTLDDLLALSPAPDALTRDLHHTPLGYSEARGTLALRQALAGTYANVHPDGVLVTTGAIEANFLLFNLLLNPGDHAVIVAPAYQQLLSVPRAIGCEVSEWRLTPESGFRFDIKELRRLVRPETKLIVINSPHNPTGASLSDAQLRDIIAIADDCGAMILSDEAYRGLRHPGGPPMATPVVDLTPRGISVGTFSKPYGLPGLRIGWIAASPELAERAWAMRDYVSLSPAKLSDRLALEAVRVRDRIFARNDEIIAANLKTAREWFAANADIASWTEPVAGLLALMKLATDVPSMEVADGLAREAKVMLAPGSVFGYEGYLRIGIGQRPDIFAEGLRRAGAYLRTLAKERVPAAAMGE